MREISDLMEKQMIINHHFNTTEAGWYETDPLQLEG